MEEKETTKITLRMGDVETCWEVPGSDANISEILFGWFGLLVAQTFYPQTIYKGMAEFIEEHADYKTFSPEEWKEMLEAESVEKYEARRELETIEKIAN